jgi:hypothetical protein
MACVYNHIAASTHLAAPIQGLNQDPKRELELATSAG